MVAVMPNPRSRKRQDKAKPTSYPEYIDVFSRMSGERVKLLDDLADDQHRSRSAMVAWIVDQYIDTEYPKLQAKRAGSKN